MSKPASHPHDSRLSQYLQDALHILELNLHLAESGELACYRAVAAQLRLLLCDTTRKHGVIVDISLAGRVFPGLRLPAIQSGRPDAPAASIPPLPLQDWLDQELALPDGSSMSIRLVIRTACDQDGGAHVDLPPAPLPDLKEAVLIVGRAALAGFRQSAPDPESG